ncbi:MAG: aromatic ring hydroxylase [Oscillospiraceae bacterium]|jgi:4-hydroxyphenylacetate 3-monooxygenase/4-hydroxybutyryl-CoA dehydratase/vinylacetyl-CoA-Delta-isomerase|nr:aromatic ring hydroxylase [Oscillospiraceae bacterium]
MGIGTYERYRERLKGMKHNIYIDGERPGREEDFNSSGTYVIKETYDCANDPEYEDVCTAVSHITGEKINRFTHIHRSREDLMKKQLMTKLLCHRVGGCIQRCMGVDAMNALEIVTYDCDQANGTNYHDRLQGFILKMQKEDLVANCAQTDVKGVRGVRPHEQPDPDQYLRIVETDASGTGIDGKPCKGIVVRGAKVCNSIAPYTDEIIALPSRFMTAKDAAYAVAFALPADWPGIKIMGLPGKRHARKHIDSPIAHVGDVESLTIFDDVFVPEERVYLSGYDGPDVVQYAGYLALMFAHYHRHSYTGCKAAVSECIAAEAALVADVNGISKYEHVREKLSNIIGTAELVFAAGEASALHAVEFPNGSWVPDEILTNCGRRLAGQQIYHEYEILADLAGGISASLPPEGNFYDPETAHLCNKYIMRNPKYTPEETHRVLRMMEDKLCDAFEGSQMVAGVHGGGSPVMETITLMGRYDMTPLMDIAKYLAVFEGVKIPKYICPTATPRAMLEKFKKFE